METTKTFDAGHVQSDQVVGKGFISSGVMEEFNKTTALMEQLKSEYQSTPHSPRLLLLDHSIQVCKAYLETLLSEEHHAHLARNAHKYGESLRDELGTSVALLHSPDYPDGSPNGPGRPDRSTRQDTRPQATIESATPKRTRPGTQSSSSQFGEAKTESDEQAMEPQKVALDVYLFGNFRAFLNRKEIVTWPKGKSKQLFKYLSAKGHNPVPKEVLMEQFWPHHSVESARNNLNVAVYSLRQVLKKMLPETSIVLFRDGCYLINPVIDLWVDARAFSANIKKAAKLEARGDQEAAIAAYHQADEAYGGAFMSGDAYADWAIELENQYREQYLVILSKLDDFYRHRNELDISIELNKKILAVDACDELAHEHLMEDYSATGQRHLALRQFNICEETLKKELGLYPQQRLVNLLNQIKEAKIA